MLCTRIFILAAALDAAALPALLAERCNPGKTAAPVLLRQPPPRCPSPHLRCNGRVVKLEVRIGRDGRAERARLLDGHPLLAGAALDAVRNWRWEAAWLNGERVAVTQQILVRYPGR